MVRKSFFRIKTNNNKRNEEKKAIMSNFYRLPVMAAITFCFITWSLISATRLPSSAGTHKKQESPLEPSIPRLPTAATFRVLQVQLVHRHGDRTPITPMSDEAYWASTLPSNDLLEKVASSTKVIRDGAPINHVAAGRGPFGKLTQLGLLQMIDLGSTLREQLYTNVYDDHSYDEHGNVFRNKGRLFDPKNPLQPHHIKVISTDFQRTILSVQGTLVGIFPDKTNEPPIEIDVRQTSIMIPDPQPRQSVEQEVLEKSLANRKYIQTREEEMFPLAVRVTESLKYLLGKGAFEISFGVGEEKADADTTKPLAWAQLAEITKCLAIRGKLPDSISSQDLEYIGAHTAWKWFEHLRDPRLVYLAMNCMVSKMVLSMQDKLTSTEESPVIIYSAHDSTLIGLLCAFRLEQPSVWPEYGSYLKLELIEANMSNGERDYIVRFSLNGQVLRSQWTKDKTLEVIPLNQLSELIQNDGTATNQV
jgi:Histidine phosphatase superfamily (branch 2)